MKIRKGDTVQILAGKDKGKQGVVLQTIPDRLQVVVDGVHVVTRHLKNKRTRSQGQVIQKPMPIHVSNVALVHKEKPVRVGYKLNEEGGKKKKVRVARPSGDVL